MYVRVSRDDGAGDASASLIGQQLQIEERVREMERAGAIGVVRGEDLALFCDDGYSGMSLKRPALRRMLAECASGSVECVCVRDLSRLSRNYIDAGDLVERVFPSFGVRFVSVAEGIDIAPGIGGSSDCEAGFSRGLISVVNNAYSLMLSRNVRSAMRLRWHAGEHVQPYVPYGYVYDRRSRGNLGIDPVASVWVRSMFEMAAGGMAPRDVADELRGFGVPTPAEYAFACGGVKAASCAGRATPWNAAKVRYIVGREVYAGVLVGGVTTGTGVGQGSPRRRTRPDEQVRVEDAHAAIVSRELFEAAQESFAHIGRGRPKTLISSIRE